MTAMTSILTWSDSDRTALELLTPALALSPALGAKVVAVWAGPNLPADLAHHGAAEVVHLKGAGLDAFTAERYTDALAAAAAELKPALVLIGATRNGKDLAARLAARLKAGGISEAQKMEVGP